MAPARTHCDLGAKSLQVSPRGTRARPPRVNPTLPPGLPRGDARLGAKAFLPREKDPESNGAIPKAFVAIHGER